MNDPIEQARLAWLGALHRFETAVKGDVSDSEYRAAKAELERAKREYDQLVARELAHGQGTA